MYNSEMKEIITMFLVFSCFQKKKPVLPGVDQWTECWPVSQGVASLIPRQDTSLGCRLGTQQGALERQPHIDVYLPLFLPPCPSLYKQINKSFFKKEKETEGLPSLGHRWRLSLSLGLWWWGFTRTMNWRRRGPVPLSCFHLSSQDIIIHSPHANVHFHYYIHHTLHLSQMV